MKMIQVMLAAVLVILAGCCQRANAAETNWTDIAIQFGTVAAGTVVGNVVYDKLNPQAPAQQGANVTGLAVTCVAKIPGCDYKGTGVTYDAYVKKVVGAGATATGALVMKDQIVISYTTK